MLKRVKDYALKTKCEALFSFEKSLPFLNLLSIGAKNHEATSVQNCCPSKIRNLKKTITNWG
jgi:hypothetical protein